MNGTETLTAEHACGVCDAPIRFAGLDDAGVPMWECTSCDWWHTSRDCCHGFQAEHRFHEDEPCFPGCPAWEGGIQTSEGESFCPACGERIDNCHGHGQLGDPQGFLIVRRHDRGDHGACHRNAECAP